MNILVLNGSPAGDNSITLQTVLYLQKLYPDHSWQFLNVGQKVRAFEHDFTKAREALAEAELILFAYPVYTFLVPAQLHRFVELMKENGPDFSAKFASQLTTSKHFYDTTAHEFIRENCADLGLKYVRGLSADMEDLLHKKGQEEARTWFGHLLWSVGKGLAQPVRQPAARGELRAVPVPTNSRPKRSKGRIVIVTDLGEDSGRLRNMIDRFKAFSYYDCDVVDLREFPFAGGCLGCFHCASDGSCIYKDGFDSFLREKIQTADATVYAYRIQDHSMGYRFKLYDDRQFCNGHRTVTMGKPVGYLVDGLLSAESNLQTLMEARAQVGGNYLAGIASNEGVPEEIDALAENLDYAVRHHYGEPANFYGVGGLKIFRDLIYQMQGLMREDHRFYKAHGFYDFPQKHRGRVAAMYLVGAMMKNPKLMQKSKVSMTEGMLLPYRKVLEKIKP